MRLSYEHLPADIFGPNVIQETFPSADIRPLGFKGPFLARKLESILRPDDLLHREKRCQLLGQWEKQLALLEPPVAALESLRTLEQPKSSIVLVESLPGILGGPLINLYKAIHAVRIARELAQRFNEAVVPVVWVLTDELAANVCQYFVNADLDLRKVSFPGIESGGQPFSRFRFDESAQHLRAVRELVCELLWDGVHTQEALDLFFPRQGESLGTAFARAMCTALGHLGLVVLVPDWIREDLSQTIARLMSVDPRRLLDKTARELESKGYAGFVDTVQSSLLCTRVNPFSGGDGYRYGGDSGSPTPFELAAKILQAPADWAAGPLIRPLCQDSVLPVAARVGGDESLASEILGSDLRLATGLPATPFIGRLSASLVGPECGRALARLGIGVGDFLSGSLGTRQVVGEANSDSVGDLLDEIAKTAAMELLSVRQALARVDEGLAVQLKRTARQVRSLIGHLAKRTRRSGSNRQGKQRRHVRRVQSGLLPNNMPQEQVISILSVIARFGQDWIVELLGQIPPLPAGHLVVRFEESLRT